MLTWRYTVNLHHLVVGCPLQGTAEPQWLSRPDNVARRECPLPSPKRNPPLQRAAPDLPALPFGGDRKDLDRPCQKGCERTGGVCIHKGSHPQPRAWN